MFTWAVTYLLSKNMQVENPGGLLEFAMILDLLVCTIVGCIALFVFTGE